MPKITDLCLLDWNNELINFNVGDQTSQKVLASTPYFTLKT
jgi:hypothetical protein